MTPAPVDPHEPWHIEQSPDEEFQWHTVDAGGHQVHVQVRPLSVQQPGLLAITPESTIIAVMLCGRG